MGWQGKEKGNAKGREERQKDEKIGATWIPLGRSLLLCDHYLSLHTPQKHTHPSPLITRHTIALHKQAPQTGTSDNQRGQRSQLYCTHAATSKQYKFISANILEPLLHRGVLRKF